MRIYLDAGSIHSEILRRRPEIDPNKSFVSLSHDASPAWATLFDTSTCVDGPVDIDRTQESSEDYHGFLIRIIKWKSQAEAFRLL